LVKKLSLYNKEDYLKTWQVVLGFLALAIVLAPCEFTLLLLGAPYTGWLNSLLEVHPGWFGAVWFSALLVCAGLSGLAESAGQKRPSLATTA
jgi:hypothetical protein